MLGADSLYNYFPLHKKLTQTPYLKCVPIRVGRKTHYNLDFVKQGEPPDPDFYM